MHGAVMHVNVIFLQCQSFLLYEIIIFLEIIANVTYKCYNKKAYDL